MDFEQLQAFVVLAHTKSFSKTAETLHLVQSTVTTRIQSLEKSIGRSLFHRNNRKVEITPAGLTLLPLAERMIKLRTESLYKLKVMEIFEERLTVGSLDTIWKYMLSPVLKNYYFRYPNIALSTRTGNSSDIIQFLMNDLIQVGFVSLKPHLPGFEVIPFYQDEIILVAHPEQQFVSPQGVYADQLAELPLIYINWGTPFQEWAEAVLKPNYLPHIQLDQASLALSFVSDNLGVSLMTRSVASLPLQKGELIQIPILGDRQPPTRIAYAVVQKEKRQRPAVEKWFDLMLENGFFSVELD